MESGDVEIENSKYLREYTKPHVKLFDFGIADVITSSTCLGDCGTDDSANNNNINSGEYLDNAYQV